MSEHMTGHMSLHYNDLTYGFLVRTDAFHSAKKEEITEFDFYSAQEEYLAMLQAASAMGSQSQYFILQAEVFLEDNLGCRTQLYHADVRIDLTEKNILLIFSKGDENISILDAPATDVALDKALRYAYGGFISACQEYSDEIHLYDVSIFEPYTFYEQSPDPGSLPETYFHTEETTRSVHVSSIQLSVEDLEDLDQLMNMTGEEIYNQYGLKPPDSFLYTMTFDDGCEMAIKFQIGDWQERPEIFYTLYDQEGRELACASSKESIHETFILDTETKGIYQAAITPAHNDSLSERIRFAEQKRDGQCNTSKQEKEVEAPCR